MKVTLHQPVEGGQPGDVIDVPEARAKWLVVNGYASGDKTYSNEDLEAKDDPTFAENREAPGEPVEKPKANEPKRQAKKAPVKKDEADDEEQPTEG